MTKQMEIWLQVPSAESGTACRSSFDSFGNLMCANLV